MLAVSSFGTEVDVESNMVARQQSRLLGAETVNQAYTTLFGEVAQLPFDERTAQDLNLLANGIAACSLTCGRCMAP